MPESGPKNDFEAKLKELGDSIHKTSEKIHEASKEIIEPLLKEMECGNAQLKISSLKTDIKMLEDNIQTFSYLQKSRGDEPNVDHLLQQLNEKQRELEELEGWYQRKCGKPKRWWQFWKWFA